MSRLRMGVLYCVLGLLLPAQAQVIELCEGGAPCDGADVRLQGAAAPQAKNFGFSVAFGRIDNDELADLAVGAPAENRVYIFLGRTETSLAPGSPDRSLDAAMADLVLTGPTGSEFGFSVAIAPGTGPRTMVVGAPATANSAAAGAAYVISDGSLNGQSGTLAVTGLAGVFTINGEAAGDQAGYAVAAGPLFSGGADDVVITARNANNGRGRVYGIPEPTMPVSLGTARQFEGSVDGEGVGEFVKLADFGLATVGQVVVGAIGTSPEEGVNPPGRVYIVDLADLGISPTPANSRCVAGESENDFFGFAFALADLESTNAVDLAVSAIYADRTGTGSGTNVGAVFIFADVLGLAPGSCPAADVTADHIIRGFRQWDEVGFGISSGQIDGTGKQDLVLTARLHDRNQLSVDEVDEGATYVIFGGGGFGAWPATLDCADAACNSGAPAGVDAMVVGGFYENSASDEIGFSVTVGDYNQDDVFDDIAVASVSHGRVYLVTINDQDGDGLRDIRDDDDDNDGVPDSLDSEPLDPNICRDTDGDTCDDCAVGTDNFGLLADFNPANDGQDTDGDGLCNLGDQDDDNDGVVDGVDPAPLSPNFCGDADGDTCDDCVVGSDDFGPLPDNLVNNDGLDTDADGLCNTGDPDDDNDGVADGPDVSNLDPDLCTDADADGCDDCSVGTDNFGPLADNLVGNDGLDTDSDGACDLGDDDDDNDGVDDGADTSPLNPDLCQDLDADTCDDCSVGTDNFGPLDDFNPANDGPDADADGLCNAGDNDADGDGAPVDSDDTNPNVCSDVEMDGCDDCRFGTFNINNDGVDTDSDSLCDAGDPDDDNDGVVDGSDIDSTNPNLCEDLDSDNCDDCSVGTDGFGALADNDVANDGPDPDLDGLCNAGDPDDDNDGVVDGSDIDSTNPSLCEDLDSDSCDDCSVGTDGFGALADNDVANDGPDLDLDGLCDAGDSDADGDMAPVDSNDLDPNVCSDTDSDGCDDCSSGTFDVGADGTDTDADGLCDLGDPDDDNDGVDDGSDIASLDPTMCQDLDGDTCDDCSVGVDGFGPAADFNTLGDGTDGDSDGVCAAGDCNDLIATCTTDCITDIDMNMIPDCEEVPPAPAPGDGLDLRMPTADDLVWNTVVGLQYHVYRGDLTTLQATGIYTQAIGSHPAADQFCWLNDPVLFDSYVPQPGETAFFLVTVDDGQEGLLGRASDGSNRSNLNACH